MERRKKIEDILRASEEPVNGAYLAKTLGVSRQTIVQDIALLRREGLQVLSTLQGYVLNHSVKQHREVMGIIHTAKQLPRELEILVAHHVTVEDVFINHPVYGRVEGRLDIATPKDLKEFLDKRSRSAVPLFSEVNNGLHFHTLVAEDPETITEAKHMLQHEGFTLVDGGH